MVVVVVVAHSVDSLTELEEEHGRVVDLTNGEALARLVVELPLEC
jgi:hypothetical protein